ncbi:protein of unknown function (DUF427) domain containing protein [Amanita muscaria]
MPKVTFNGTVLAESSDTQVVEGNHYFPPSSINKDYFSDSATHAVPTLVLNTNSPLRSTVCPWKGTASYYNVSVDGQTIKDAAWYYPNAADKAKSIEGYVAFYKNKVSVEA